VISRKWLFGVLTALVALFITFILYWLGLHVKRSYNRMKTLVSEKEKEIELLTDLWKIDEAEIEWIAPISQGRLGIMDRCDNWYLSNNKIQIKGDMVKYGSASGENTLWQSRSC